MSDDQVFTSHIKNLQPGDHVSCMYQNHQELLSILIPFFEIGLKENNQCIYVLGKESESDVINSFLELGVDLAPHKANGSFIFMTTENVYLESGEFDPEKVILKLEEAASNAKALGYKALRLSANTFWLNDSENNKEALKKFSKYEAKVNQVIHQYGIIALCQYEKSLFTDSFLLDSIRTHPYIFLNNKVITSHYFAPSGNFIPLNDDPQSLTKSKTILDGIFAQGGN